MLDGLSAVAATEAHLIDAAALGASFPAAAGARALARRETDDHVNDFGWPTQRIEADSPRGALAATIGLTASGQRAATFVSGPDLASAHDLMRRAATNHLPMVVHLACRATAAHAEALGTGHEAYMAAIDSGWIQAFATSAQDTVDLALIARRVAERALVPMMIACDGEQTALAVQDVLLPDDMIMRDFVGEPADRIEAPTEAQRMLFGDTRRRVPRLYDTERPVMLSPLVGPESWAHGTTGVGPFFGDHVREALREATDVYAAQTGRRLDPIVTHRTEDATIVLVAQGVAVETLVAFADWARQHARVKVGVIGVRFLRPFDGATVARHLKGKQTVAVLERVTAPLSGDGPLLREVRAALDRSRENARFGEDIHAGYPSISEKHTPRFVSVPYGLGGLPLRAADLAALLQRLDSPDRATLYLGLEFARPTSRYPKRQVLMDQLRRSYPHLDRLGVRGRESAADLRPNGATTIAVHRLAGQHVESLAGEAANLVHELLGGHLRSRPALTWQRFDQPCVEHIIHSAHPLHDPGDDAPVDLAVVAGPRIHPLMPLTERLVDGGTLLVMSERTGDGLLELLPQPVLRDLRERNVQVRAFQPQLKASEPWRETEQLLGAITAIMLQRAGLTTDATRKARTAREAMLADLPDDERSKRMDAFILGFGSLVTIDVAASKASGRPTPSADVETPLAVRQFSRPDTTVECLPRLWDQIGVLYRTGETSELTADPYLAAGAVPPLSSTFRDVSDARTMLPVFDPASCDGSGELWSSDPDGAIAPLVISSRGLIDAGIALASSAGQPADTLRSIAGKFAKQINKVAGADDDPPTTAGGLLEAAFEQVIERESEPRAASLRKALDAAIEQIGELPLARTRVFFDEREAQHPGTGEFLAIVVNPDACKSPEVALAACGGRGLRAVEQTPDEIDRARRLWKLWQQLPDTSGETIEYARHHTDVGPMAAMLLSRACLLAMSGGDGAEAGSGGGLALRHVLAACEFHLQPRLQDLLGQIDELREELAGRIREMLADALPTSDLDALASGLDVLGRGDVELSELSGKLDRIVSGGHVDGARLGRRVDVARGLADLSWRLAEGPDDLGRARVGLTIAGGPVARQAGAFPYNPFAGPVMIDSSGESAALARGLIEGQIRQTVAAIRLIRWARLELHSPSEAARGARELMKLRFNDLTAEERRLCPPMLVVGDGRTLGERGLSQLAWLLDLDLPIKVLVLSDIGGKADDALGVDALDDYPAAQRFDLAMLALLNRKAFVTQTSIADGRHFAEGVLGALEFDGPALIHIHAPSPERHGFAIERLHHQAELAVRSRAYPLFTFDPAGEGVFGSCLDLTANPDVKATFCAAEDSGKLTPVHWAATERRFASHLPELESSATETVPITEYLELDRDKRAGKTPFIELEIDGVARKRRIDDVLLADTEQRLRLWRTLQELAGVVTPFTRQVREAAEQELSQTHADQLERLKRTYEAEIADLKASFDADAARRVTSRLMELAGYDTASNGGGRAS